MNLDITTISTYRRRAFEKLNVQNVIELKDKFFTVQNARLITTIYKSGKAFQKLKGFFICIPFIFLLA
jgi:hypothetical protein